MILSHWGRNSHNGDNIDGLVQESCNSSALDNIDGLVQERRNSIATALELHLSSTNTLILFYDCIIL